RPVCPRCNTILRPDQAVCAACGKSFDGWIAACDACSAPMKAEPVTSEEREAYHSLASVPGISEERAKALALKGFRDFADVVRLALPESAVRQGLHHTIARKVLLADLVPRPQHAESGARCPMCGAAWLANATRCASCGSAFGLALAEAPLIDETVELIGLRLGACFSSHEFFQLRVSILVVSARLTITIAMALMVLYPASELSLRFVLWFSSALIAVASGVGLHEISHK